MHFKYSFVIFLIFSFILGCSENIDQTQEVTQDDRPNILFIVADDMGYSDLGAFGAEISTPNLDALAFEGMRLTNFRTATACLATRARMMTSSIADHVIEDTKSIFDGVLYRGGERGIGVSENWALLPELLQDAGYQTFAAGKWDLGARVGHNPATRGFDRSFVNSGASNSHFKEEIYQYPFLYQDDGELLANADLPEDFYATEYYTDRMIDYISSSSDDSPWFAYVPYTAPHWPLGLPDDWLDRYDGRYDEGYEVLKQERFERALELGVVPPGGSLDNYKPTAAAWDSLTTETQVRHIRAQEIYAGMVEYMDMSAGRIIDLLHESGEIDNTVIMFVSDHGASAAGHALDPENPQGRNATGGWKIFDNSIENFGRPGSFIDHGNGFGEAATVPFKFFKSRFTEGGTRAVGFIYFPKLIDPGVTNELMGMVDILPSFVDIAESKHPGAGYYKDREINDILGYSFWPYITGQAEYVRSSDQSIGWVSSRNNSGAYIKGNYKIIKETAPDLDANNLHTDWTLDAWKLFDLSVDPGEHFDLASENPDLLNQLVEEWTDNYLLREYRNPSRLL
ncbi:MAG: hypothetical protein CBC38_03500 [Gammaproteobacteria bacterium TMED78]|nr:MAG: hypothetical protein CBC38_03500 [Gammaproteobacteria bacterium TMED78]|tara:strand:- start:5965 stop:7668 length:1704 start_codon:yes stop_codon:yes gene_type:complete